MTVNPNDAAVRKACATLEQGAEEKRQRAILEERLKFQLQRIERDYGPEQAKKSESVVRAALGIPIIAPLPRTTTEKKADAVNKRKRGARVKPIPMLLFCPHCGAQHVDAPSGEWKNPPHREHLCGECGGLWRPANVNTTGVLELPKE